LIDKFYTNPSIEATDFGSLLIAAKNGNGNAMKKEHEYVY